MKRWLFLLPAGMLVLTGCSTAAMKGTPFYTGEYPVREGPAADRVNLWPLAYYRAPALSVLWPVMDFSLGHKPSECRSALLAQRSLAYRQRTRHLVSDLELGVGRRRLLAGNPLAVLYEPEKFPITIMESVAAVRDRRTFCKKLPLPLLRLAVRPFLYRSQRVGPYGSSSVCV